MIIDLINNKDCVINEFISVNVKFTSYKTCDYDVIFWCMWPNQRKWTKLVQHTPSHKVLNNLIYMCDIYFL